MSPPGTTEASSAAPSPGADPIPVTAGAEPTPAKPCPSVPSGSAPATGSCPDPASEPPSASASGSGMPTASGSGMPRATASGSGSASTTASGACPNAAKPCPSVSVTGPAAEAGRCAGAGRDSSTGVCAGPWEASMSCGAGCAGSPSGSGVPTPGPPSTRGPRRGAPTPGPPSSRPDPVAVAVAAEATASSVPGSRPASGSTAGCRSAYPRAPSKSGWFAQGAGAPPGRVAGAWLQSAAGALRRNSPVCPGSSDPCGTCGMYDISDGMAHCPRAPPSGSCGTSGNRHSAVAAGSGSGSASANAAATDAGIGMDAGIGPPTGAGAVAESTGAEAPASGHCTGIAHVPVAAGSVLTEPSGTIIGGGT